MRRLIRFIALSIMLILTSCYDDSEIWQSLKDHESRIERLEQLTDQYNTNLTALKAIVDALKANDYVTNIIPIVLNGKEIGFTITFAHNDPITIYFGEASDGDIVTVFPEIGIAKDTDGNYYWTLDGEWITDGQGNKIPASGKDGEDGKDGITPQLKIDEGHWYVSYDNGVTWEVLGDVPVPDSGPSGSESGVFAKVEVRDNSVIFTLTDGTEIIVPKSTKVEFKLSDVKSTSVTFTGVARPISPDFEVGIYYSTDSKVQVQKSEKASCVDFDENNAFEINLSGLKPNTIYYWRSYVSMYGDIEYSETGTFTTTQINNLVKQIKYAICDVEGSISGWLMNYKYDDSDKPVQLMMENFGEEEDSEIFTFNIIDKGAAVSVEQYYHDNLESVCDITFDSKNRVCALDETYGEYGFDFRIEYNTDGTQKKITASNDSYLYEVEYTYKNSCISTMTERWIEGDEVFSDMMTFDESIYFPNKLLSGKINVDLNLPNILYLPDDAYKALTHLGYCGKGFGGEYMCEAVESDLFFSNFIDKDGGYWGETNDSDFYEHHRETIYRDQEGKKDKLSYEFDDNGYPIRFTASSPVNKYLVEYDLVAGSVLHEWEEDIDGEIVIFRRYEIVRTNVRETFIETVYETLEGEILYK